MKNATLFLTITLTLVLNPIILAADAKPAAKEPAPFAVQVTGTGRPMILIPGLGCGGSVWDDTVAHFKDRYQCHVVTLAGFAGQPSILAPMLPKVRDGLIAYINDKKLDHPIIVGHSLGGFMAYWVAATAPDKVGPIVVVDSVPFFPAMWNAKATVESSMPFAEQMRDMYKGQTREQFATGFRAMLGSMMADKKNVELVAASFVKSDPNAVGEAGYELMSTDLRPDVKNIKSPLLLLGAMPSIKDPNAQKAIMANYQTQVAPIPTHKLVWVANAKHFIMLDQPEAFYKEVDAFLKDADAKKGK